MKLVEIRIQQWFQNEKEFTFPAANQNDANAIFIVFWSMSTDFIESTSLISLAIATNCKATETEKFIVKVPRNDLRFRSFCEVLFLTCNQCRPIHVRLDDILAYFAWL